MISDFPDLLPVLRATTAEQVVQQLEIIGRKGTQAAFRLRPNDESGTTAFFDSIRAIKEMSQSLLVILDLEDIRGQVEPSVKVANAFFSRLFEAMGDGAEDLETVLLSNSFPRGSLRELPRTLQMQEIKLHADVANTFPVRYGDYMSIPPRMTSNQTRNGWLPHVDFITSGYWNVHLHDANRDPTKFIEASTDIVGEDYWRSRIDCWGTSVIERVKETEDLSVDGRKFTQPAPWITVRANQHLTMMALNR